MFRTILLIIGLGLLYFGIYETYRSFKFLEASIQIDAQILGYSSFQKLERIPGECSAYRKSCEIDLRYTLPTGEVIQTAIPQPMFTRTQGTELSILVDPKDPTHPQIAALHALFRNGMVTMFLGLAVLFMRWLIGMKPLQDNEARS